MSTYQYIKGTNHAETLSAALDAFCRALTRRWRDEVCRAIVLGDPDFPRWITREGSVAQPSSMIAAIQRLFPEIGRGEELQWDCWSPEARAHLEVGSACAYVWWVDQGQDGELSSITCLGYTDGRSDPYGQPVPERIVCGMGIILEQVADWAYAEREHVFSQLPLFDRHDVSALEAAHGTLIRLGGELGLDAEAGSDESLDGAFRPVEDRAISATVTAISGRGGVSNDWLVGWTGLAADHFKSGFAESVVPTVNNQSLILGVLANLYAARAAIIEKGRRDALYWIQSATVSLGLTEEVHVDHSNFWVAVEGIGMATGIAFAWTGAGPVVGAGIALVGFMGQYLDPGSTVQGYAHDMVAVVQRLNDEIANVNQAITDLEHGYAMDVAQLRETIHGVHSYNLELYDLTQNDPDGNHDPPGVHPADEDEPTHAADTFSVEIEFVLQLGASCYDAGKMYAGLLPIIAETKQADGQLVDRDGRQTIADGQLIEVRDQLEEFLKTTCGRYVVAGDQVRAAAEAYVDVDTTQREAFNRIMARWEENQIGEFEAEFDPEEYAAATNRPWTWAPDLDYPGPGGISPPGVGASDDYFTESDAYGGAGR